MSPLSRVSSYLTVSPLPFLAVYFLLPLTSHCWELVVSKHGALCCSDFPLAPQECKRQTLLLLSGCKIICFCLIKKQICSCYRTKSEIIRFFLTLFFIFDVILVKRRFIISNCYAITIWYENKFCFCIYRKIVLQFISFFLCAMCLDDQFMFFISMFVCLLDKKIFLNWAPMNFSF